MQEQTRVLTELQGLLCWQILVSSGLSSQSLPPCTPCVSSVAHLQKHPWPQHIYLLVYFLVSCPVHTRRDYTILFLGCFPIITNSAGQASLLPMNQLGPVCYLLSIVMTHFQSGRVSRHWLTWLIQAIQFLMLPSFWVFFCIFMVNPPIPLLYLSLIYGIATFPTPPCLTHKCQDIFQTLQKMMLKRF